MSVLLSTQFVVVDEEHRAVVRNPRGDVSTAHLCKLVEHGRESGGIDGGRLEETFPTETHDAELEQHRVIDAGHQHRVARGRLGRERPDAPRLLVGGLNHVYGQMALRATAFRSESKALSPARSVSSAPGRGALQTTMSADRHGTIVRWLTKCIRQATLEG